MQIDWLGLWRAPFFDLPARQIEGWALLGLYGLVLIAALVSTRQSWRDQHQAHRWLVFVALCLTCVVFNNVLAWHYPIARPPVPNRPEEASGLAAPLLGSLPIVLAGAWLGAGPAMVVGFLGGLTRALFIHNQLSPAFEFALFGLLAGFLLRQDYSGRLFAVLRQPIIGTLAARLLIWLLTLPGIYVYTPGESLYALDYTWPLFLSGWLPALVEGLIAGVGTQILFMLWPALRPPRTAHFAPPFARSLNRRLLFTLAPIMLVMIAALVYAVAATTINAATQQAIEQMARDSVSASQGIPYFFQTGQNLIGSLSGDADLRSTDANVRQNGLAQGVRTGAFFDEMLVTDAGGSPNAIYPTTSSKQLTADEKTLVTRAIASGAPGISDPQRVTTGTLLVSFVVPLEDGTPRGARVGAIVGRSRMNVNPVMARVVSGLQKTLGTGEGFVVDTLDYSKGGRIVLADSGRADRLLTDWQLDDTQPVLAQVSDGKAYVASVEDGTRRLIYVRPVQGYPWTTVIELPYSSVLGLAAQVSAPLLALLLAVTAIACVAVFAVSRRVTQPLTALSNATAQIAEGKLDAPVLVRGEDEVGQLGEAFEQMRASLKGRLEDLSLLVRASQAVASSLDLQRGAPPILEGAMESCGARAARLILLDPDGLPKSVWMRGDLARELTPLDRRLAELALVATEPLWVESVARMRGQFEPALVGNVRSLGVLPMRRLSETTGFLWVAFGEPHHFTDTEKNILITLAGQADVLIENSRLFQTAENERQRLAAILISTSDAVIVTSPDDRVLLMNPAAEIAFSVVATRVVGKRLQDTVLDAAVIQLLVTPPATTNGPQTGEILLPDGRTLYGIASAIRLENGQTLGRVAVMRDVTRFKELDAMKTEFVATVSHDLRSPLTYMRGYAAMLPMVGELSPKQAEYIEKIQGGIQQMTELIDDLLDMGRIEARVGMQRAECVPAEVVKIVADEAQGRALAFGLTLQTEINTQRSVMGDPALIKRAVSNLVDNAIKYTPPGGKITLSLDEAGTSLIIRVADNGFGIAAEDQVRLFEKFYRVKRRETMDIKGSGLGLAIVKSIAEWHHGRVWVESQLGAGSTFYITLPIRAEASVAPA